MIRKSIGCVRFVFNYALAEQRKEENYWRITEELVQNGALPKNNWKGDFFKDSKAQADLKELKKNYPWLKEPDSTSLQFSLQELGKAFSSYYKKEKGKPKFKSKKNEVQSFTSKCNKSKNGPTIRIEQHGKKSYLLLPKIGWVHFAKSKEIIGKIKKATVRVTPRSRIVAMSICEPRSCIGRLSS